MNMSQYHSEKYFASLQSDSSLKVLTTSLHLQKQDLQIIDYRPSHNHRGFNFSGITFIKDCTQQKPIQCCRKGSPLLQQIKSQHLPEINLNIVEGKLAITTSEGTNQKQEIRQKLGQMATGRGTVELIKVQQPHGSEIQVSFSQIHQGWVISDSITTTFKSLEKIQAQQTEENPLAKLIQFWESQISKCKDIELLKQLLTRFTFCGKIASDWTKVCWYCVVETTNRSLICEDLFDAKSLVEKVGFTFARIKTISMLNNEDQMIRTLDKLISSVQSAYSVGKDNRFGRCKVYFVSNTKKEVLGGFNIVTLEDNLFELMQLLCSAQLNTQEKISYFEEICLLFQSKDVRFPFPYQHYLVLFKKIVRFVELVGATKAAIGADWLWILKCVLYLELKMIGDQSLFVYFFKNDGLKQHLSEVSLEELGPIGCSIITIFCLLTPSKHLRSPIIESLKNSFKQLELHFEVLPSSNQHQICLHETIEQINSKPVQALNHYLIDAIPRSFQLKCLIRQLQLHAREGSHFQLRIISEKEDSFVNIDENIYPFSMGSILNAYQLHLERQQQAKRLAEKAQEMMKVTEAIENLKNQQFRTDQKFIFIDLLENRQQQKEIVSAVQSIFRQKRGSLNPYFVLMIGLGKRQLVPTFDLEQITTHIISDTYYQVKTYAFEP